MGLFTPDGRQVGEINVVIHNDAAQAFSIDVPKGANRMEAHRAIGMSIQDTVAMHVLSNLVCVERTRVLGVRGNIGSVLRDLPPLVTDEEIENAGEGRKIELMEQKVRREVILKQDYESLVDMAFTFADAFVSVRNRRIMSLQQAVKRGAEEQ